jgi:hypothetical protein
MQSIEDALELEQFVCVQILECGLQVLELRLLIAVAFLLRGFDQRPELIVGHGLTANQWHEFQKCDRATFA